MKKDKKEKKAFSKVLLIQESVLIWVITIAVIALAFICVFNGFFGELPWLTAMVALPWSAYAISQNAYYRKSMKENTKDGIVFEQAMNEFNLQDTDDPTEDPEIL